VLLAALVSLSIAKQVNFDVFFLYLCFECFIMNIIVRRDKSVFLCRRKNTYEFLATCTIDALECFPFIPFLLSDLHTLRVISLANNRRSDFLGRSSIHLLAAKFSTLKLCLQRTGTNNYQLSI
jgi:hypothetical protein